MFEPTTEATEQSLADYRASRETPAETAAVAEEKTAVGADAALADQVADTERPAVEPAEEDEDEQERPRKKGGFQRKIERLTEENDELRRKLAGDKPAEKTADAPRTGDEPQYDKPKPRLEDFDSLEAHTEALTDWKLDERDWKRDQKAAAEQAQQQQTRVLDGWNKQLTAVKESHSDYDAAVAAVADIELSPLHQRLLLEDERGAELAYALAQDRGELEKFASLEPLAAAKLLGRLTRTLADDDTPAPKPTTKSAPPPIRPVGSRAVSPGIDPAKASHADYRRARETGKIR